MHSDNAGQMGVRLDAAGHHDLTARVDDPAGFRGGIRCPDQGDFFAGNRDVPIARPMRSYDLTAADQ